MALHFLPNKFKRTFDLFFFDTSGAFDNVPDFRNVLVGGAGIEVPEPDDPLIVNALVLRFASELVFALANLAFSLPETVVRFMDFHSLSDAPSICFMRYKDDGDSLRS